jgi:hypothetical protein
MIKIVQFVFAWVFLWFLTTVITRQIWLFPVVFFGLCGYEVSMFIHRKRQQAKQEPTYAEVVQETQVRVARECRAVDAAENGDLCILTDEAIKMFCNPN